MRFLITRKVFVAGGATATIPVGTARIEEAAQGAVTADSGAIGQLLRRKVENPDGPGATVGDALSALGIVGFGWAVVAIDDDELVQLAGGGDVRELVAGGKLVS